MISSHPKGPSLRTNSFISFQSNFLTKSLENPKNELWVTPDIIEELPYGKSRNLISCSEISLICKKDDEKINGERSFFSSQKQSPLSNFHLLTDRSILNSLIKKFILRLKNALGLRNLDQGSNLHLPFINDFTAFSDLEVNQTKIFKTFKCYQKLLENLKSYSFIKTFANFFLTHNTLLYPYQFFKLLWDFVHLMIIIYWFFSIPLFFAFDDLENIDRAGAYLTIFFMIFDIFLNFNTAYFHKGLLEKSRWKIFSHYCKKHLKFDLITLIPIMFDAFIGGENFEYNTFLHLLKFIFFLKISTCQAIFSRILEKLLLKEKFQHIRL